MRGRGHTKTDLLFRQGVFADGPPREAVAGLVQRVFDVPPLPDDASLHWRVFAAFTADGTCVASLEARVLPMLLDGDRADVTGLRRVAVDPEWRGLGLFRDLMGPALAWCEAQTPHPILLYTAEPALYTRFGFAPLAQYAFRGLAPVRRLRPSHRRAKGPTPNPADLLHRLLPSRTPVSSGCALAGAADLVRRNILADDDLVIAYAESLDAIVLYEEDGDDLILVDVIAAAMPSLADILDTLGLAPRQVTVLFAPDRLAWSGAPVLDETGLMARGDLPDAMTRPFMLPPTAEF